MNRNLLREYPIALKEIGNRADTKVIEPVELDLFFPNVKYQKRENVVQPSVHFPVIVNQI